MLTIRKLLTALVLSIGLFALSACHQTKEAANTIKIGTIAGPETELMEVAKQIAKEKYGLNVKIVTFTDYNMPNEALADGSIDANMFQTVAFLDEAMQAKGYKFAVVGNTFIYPMGIYSQKIKKLSDLRKDAVVAIPNDPNNEARALLLLQEAGIILLRQGATINATPLDIIKNPKQVKIKTLDAAQLPRALPDVDIAPINTNYAVMAGLMPSRDALFLEPANSKYYVNVVVVRANEKNDAKFKQLMDALHSPEVLAKAKDLFKGQAIPGWQQS